MKKLLMAALVLIGFSAATLAQTTPAVKKTEPSKVQVAKKTTPVPAANKATSATTKPTAAVSPGAAVPLKKDGTPDKRYKANQGSTTGPVKKDGTPDMRYKANKKKG